MHSINNFIGVGFRREISDEILNLDEGVISFLEISPENWIDVGGILGKAFTKAAQKYPLTSHGLSLSIGSPEPLDWDYLKQLKVFFKKFPVQIFSEHLSYCKCGNAHLYDLLPIPFTEEAIRHVSGRIKEVQDFLERPIAIENVSYYYSINPEMGDGDFLSRIVEEANCNILLDVNNVYVNAFNHQYDPYDFLKKIPLDKVVYIHMAGHEKVAEDLIIDTHGQKMIDPVYQLFEWVVSKINPVPVLLERDANFNDFSGLVNEIENLRNITERHWVSQYATF